MSLDQPFETEGLSPYDTKYFDEINGQVSQINFEVKHISHFQQQRQKKFIKSMQQYKKQSVFQKRYLEKERKGLERNTEHCNLRNEWYKNEIKKSWQIAISNRPLVLRSLARTNILKREADQWLSSIDDNVLSGYVNDSYSGHQNDQEPRVYNQSAGGQNDLRGSKLIDKYNQILSEYFHKI